MCTTTALRVPTVQKKNMAFNDQKLGNTVCSDIFCCALAPRLSYVGHFSYCMCKNTSISSGVCVCHFIHFFGGEVAPATKQPNNNANDIGFPLPERCIFSGFLLRHPGVRKAFCNSSAQTVVFVWFRACLEHPALQMSSNKGLKPIKRATTSQPAPPQIRKNDQAFFLAKSIQISKLFCVCLFSHAIYSPISEKNFVVPKLSGTFHAGFRYAKKNACGKQGAPSHDKLCQVPVQNYEYSNHLEPQAHHNSSKKLQIRTPLPISCRFI